MTTTTITTVDAKAQFTDIINRVAHSKERVILTRRGKEIAAIISLEDFQLIEECLDKSDLKDAMESLKESREQGTITLAELKEEIR